MFGKAFDRTTLFFFILAIGMGAICYMLKGAEVTTDALGQAIATIISIVPSYVLGLLTGGLASTLLSKDVISRTLGKSSGYKGLILATGAGIATPTGPFMSFPIVIALWKSGADVGVLVTYLSAWAVLSALRVFIWEIPLMGSEFALLRFAICLPLPIVAGLIARWLSNYTALMPTVGRDDA